MIRETIIFLAAISALSYMAAHCKTSSNFSVKARRLFSLSCISSSAARSFFIRSAYLHSCASMTGLNISGVKALSPVRDLIISLWSLCSSLSAFTASRRSSLTCCFLASMSIWFWACMISERLTARTRSKMFRTKASIVSSTL